MANSVFMKAEEVQEMLGVSRSESYRIIKKLNDDLKAKGFLFHGYSTTVVSVGMSVDWEQAVCSASVQE